MMLGWSVEYHSKYISSQGKPIFNRGSVTELFYFNSIKQHRFSASSGIKTLSFSRPYRIFCPLLSKVRLRNRKRPVFGASVLLKTIPC